MNLATKPWTLFYSKYSPRVSVQINNMVKQKLPKKWLGLKSSLFINSFIVPPNLGPRPTKEYKAFFRGKKWGEEKIKGKTKQTKVSHTLKTLLHYKNSPRKGKWLHSSQPYVSQLTSQRYGKTGCKVKDKHSWPLNLAVKVCTGWLISKQQVPAWSLWHNTHPWD